jgi:hypothetical protein
MIVTVFIQHENHLQQLVTAIGGGLSIALLVVDVIINIINVYTMFVVIILDQAVVIVKDLHK